MFTQPIDMVYPIGPGCEWGAHEELRYSLRSACKNVPGLRNVYLVGHCPTWVKNVIHLPHGDPHTSNKDANLIDKVRFACERPELSEYFIRLSDDQYFLKQFLLEDQLVPVASNNYLTDPINQGSSKYLKRAKRTRDYLIRNRHTAWNFDGHMPYVYNKSDFARVMAVVDYQTPPGYCINTLYFNSAGVTNPRTNFSSLQVHIGGHFSLNHLQSKIVGKHFLNNDFNGLNDAYKQLLQLLFPEKCRFE